MSPDLNTIPVSVTLFTELVEKATRYDVIRKSIIENIRNGKTYNIVNHDMIRLVTETTNEDEFRDPLETILGTPETEESAE